jgi:hypothetical protein
VHKTSISAAVLDGEGKLVMQSVLATQAAAILDFLRGLRGTLHLTFEEGTHAAWLYDRLRPHVAQLSTTRSCADCKPPRGQRVHAQQFGQLSSIDLIALVATLGNSSGGWAAIL